MKHKVDVVILTVLQEEYDAICSKLIDLHRWPGNENNPNLYAWQIGIVSFLDQGTNYSVAIGMTGRAGNSQSTAATLESVQLWQPRYILFVGVAGSLSEVTRGDVVIADVIHGYEYGKVDQGFIPRSDWTFHTDIGLRNGAAAYAQSGDWRKLIQKKPPQPCKAKAAIGMIVSGDKVVDNPEDPFFQQILSVYLKAKAVEMEGAGVCHAIEQCIARGKAIGFLMVRGISDVPRAEGNKTETRGTQERDNWKPFAADVAAAFAIGYISNGLPDLPIQRRDSFNRTAVISPSVIRSDPIPQQLRQPPDCFKGREKEISDILTNFGKGAIITGMAGIGKTALALILAERLKNRFPDGQLYIDLLGTRTEHLSPSQAMAHVIHSYRPADRLPDDFSQLKSLYRSVLADKHALLLLDNAADRDQLEDLLPPSSCAVLITSRNRFTLPDLKPGIIEKNISILKSDEACELLLAIAERIGDQADELAELCGYLPLALRNAASVLAERIDIGVANYIRSLMNTKARLGLVEASFELSFNLLMPDQQDKWCMLSTFQADFDYAAAAYIWQKDMDWAEYALSDLVKLNLVDYFPSSVSSEYGRYHLHELARLFTNSRLAEGNRNLSQQRYVTYYLLLLDTANELYQKGGKNVLNGLELFDREQVNILAGQAWAESKVIQAKEIKSEAKDIEFALSMSNAYAYTGSNLLDLRLDPYDKIHWIKVGLDAAQELNDRNAEGLHLGNLGSAYLDIGESRKTIELEKRALSIFQEIGYHEGECAVTGNLGLAFYTLGEISKAMEFFRQHLDISRKIGNRHEECIALLHMGDAYRYLENNGQAIELYEQALGISKEIGDRRAESTILGNIGYAFFSNGDIKTAIELFQFRLDIANEIGDKKGECSASGRLGNAYFVLNNALKAIEYYKRQLTISNEIFDLRGKNCALSGLGNAYLALGETDEAIEHYELALEIDREIGDLVGEGIDLGNLGNAYMFRNETRKAIEYYEQRLSVAYDAGDKRGERNVLSNLGNAYAIMGEPLKSIKYYKKYLFIVKKIGNRFQEGETCFKISLELDKLDQRPQAIKCAQKALQIFEQIENPLQAQKVRQQLAAWQSQKEES
jgi:tetratricopeptide (TPR) repeat protein/nucleoside phosphorylase